MNRLQKQIEVKEPKESKKNKTNKWDIADIFMATLSLAVLNAFMVYWIFSNLNYDWRVETAIAGVLALVLNMYITKAVLK